VRGQTVGGAINFGHRAGHLFALAARQLPAHERCVSEDVSPQHGRRGGRHLEEFGRFSEGQGSNPETALQVRDGSIGPYGCRTGHTKLCSLISKLPNTLLVCAQ